MDVIIIKALALAIITVAILGGIMLNAKKQNASQENRNVPENKDPNVGTLEYVNFGTDDELKKAADAICMQYEDENLRIQRIDGFSKAVVGISNNHRLIYSYEKMVEILMERDSQLYEEAVEYIEYNVIRALPYYEPQPVILYDLFDYAF